MRISDYGKTLSFCAVLAIGLGAGAAFAEEQKPLPAPPTVEQVQPKPAEPMLSDEARKQLQDGIGMIIDGLKSIETVLGIVRASPDIAIEAIGIYHAIETEAGNAARIGEMEAKCLGGDDVQCAKVKRELCPQLAASYKAIADRFATFNKRVSDSKLSGDAKAVVANLSDMLSSGIKQLKEQLEKGHCVDA